MKGGGSLMAETGSPGDQQNGPAEDATADRERRQQALQQLAALQPVSMPRFEMRYTPGSPSTDFVQWSPDGRHLLVLAPAMGTITLFGPGQLRR